LLGNPHSHNPSSNAASVLAFDVRTKVLEALHANHDSYCCIFTANATHALKIIAEAYDFTPAGSAYLYCEDAHNSVVGIREFARKKLSNPKDLDFIPLNDETLFMDDIILGKKLVTTGSQLGNRLFAFPAQSNVSGHKHSLEYIRMAQDLGWDVLLDAAAFAPQNELDLRVYQPNFICLSFYKMFGFPTGFGCLLVRKDSYHKLKKQGFFGGSAKFTSADASKQGSSSYEIYGQDVDFNVSSTEMSKRMSMGFEDGTIDFNNLKSVEIGIDYWMRTRPWAQQWSRFLTAKAIDELSTLHHTNGQSLLTILGTKDLSKRGATLAMIFHDAEGKAMDIKHIQNKACEPQWNLSIRGGRMCNPGLADRCPAIQGEQGGGTLKYQGAIRISFGIASRESDVDTFVAFCKTFLS
jgi:selenocysteine lyase/cysteine desulfurase